MKLPCNEGDNTPTRHHIIQKKKKPRSRNIYDLVKSLS